jgi:hypothetical protein
MSDLAQILDGDDPAEAPAAEPAAEVANDAAPAEAEPTGDPEPQAAEPKAEEEKPDPTPESEDSDPWTKTAYLDEKRKRQAAETRLNELEQQRNNPPIARPDVFQDPEGAFRHTENIVAQQVGNMKTEMSQELMRQFHDDYDVREAQFLQLAAENPQLSGELARATNPAKFAYETAVKHEQYQEMQDLPTYKAKLKAEILAEIKAEQNGEQTEANERVADIPPSLSTSRSTGGANPNHRVSETLTELIGE